MVDNISTAPANSKLVQLEDKGNDTEKSKDADTKKSELYDKLYHVTENNRIYLTDMIVVNHNLLF